LDRDLALKAAANYDHEGEAAAQAWVEGVLKEPFDAPFAAALRDGTRLCRLVNTIAPNSVKKVNASAMPFKQMENISNFLKACRALGVAEHSVFETVDLFEGKDVGLVVRCLFALGSAIQCSVPAFAGPHLGAKPHTTNKREFSAEQVRTPARRRRRRACVL
jgi:transgelin